MTSFCDDSDKPPYSIIMDKISQLNVYMFAQLDSGLVKWMKESKTKTKT
jgi:hypothetical protein